MVKYCTFRDIIHHHVHASSDFPFSQCKGFVFVWRVRSYKTLILWGCGYSLLNLLCVMFSYMFHVSSVYGLWGVLVTCVHCYRPNNFLRVRCSKIIFFYIHMTNKKIRDNTMLSFVALIGTQFWSLDHYFNAFEFLMNVMNITHTVYVFLLCDSNEDFKIGRRSQWCVE